MSDWIEATGRAIFAAFAMKRRMGVFRIGREDEYYFFPYPPEANVLKPHTVVFPITEEYARVYGARTWEQRRHLQRSEAQGPSVYPASPFAPSVLADSASS